METVVVEILVAEAVEVMETTVTAVVDMAETAVVETTAEVETEEVTNPKYSKQKPRFMRGFFMRFFQYSVGSV